MTAWSLTDRVLEETYTTYVECGRNQTKTAKQIGISRGALQERLQKAELKGLHLSAGGRDAMKMTQLNGVEIAGGYRHVYDSDGKKVETVRWNAPKRQVEMESLLEQAVTAFSDIPKAPLIPSPKSTNRDLLTLYPVFDAHLGMRADSAETGGDDYGTRLAVSDINMAVGNVMALSPDSEDAILLVGGDFFHATDDTNQTQRSKNVLDVDTRMFRTMDIGIDVIAATIDRIASKHKNITVRVLRGNHDEISHMVLTLGLSQRYLDHKRIKIEKCRRDIFMYQWGRCLIAAHHGDKQKPERLAMVLAEICPFWSASPHRIILTGHAHHVKSEEFPGIVWEQVRAFCPPDAYGAQFAPRRAMHALTFNKHTGIAIRAYDPIVRTA